MVKGKIALVTGGGSGIGRATCEILARDGARVVVADVNDAGAEETLKLLPGTGHMTVHFDVTKKQSIEDGIKAIKKHYLAPPTICVNNAGILYVGALLDHTDEITDKLIDVNMKGTINTSSTVIRELLEAKLPGSIINISSMGIKGNPFGAVYAATKGAIVAFSNSIAKEFGKEGIRCNTIVPGNIDTPMSQTVDAEYPQFVDKLLDTLAMHRKGKPSELGEAIAFLASEKSSYITGASIWVDGGL